MVNPELKKLQVMAGIIQDETQHITGDVILSEETLLEFEELWKGNIVLEGFEQLNEADKEKVKAFMKIMKDLAMKLFNGIKSVGRFVWDKFWSLVTAILKTVWKNPLTTIGGALGITAWNVLIKALDFSFTGPLGNTWSSQAGTGLNQMMKDQIANGWDSMSQAIGSYQAPSAGMAPAEWMANALSAGFDAIGMAMPAFIESTQAVVGWLMTIGSFPVVQLALLWLFLIGAADWAFDMCKKLLSGFINNMLKKPMDFAKQQSQDMKSILGKDEKGIADRSNDFSNKLKGIDLKGVDVTNPGATNMNPEEKT